ncbi:hypothetical protein [Dethiobacter alkaliphilus]|uniref:Uncharacterized protein n=1 Tax=Dethiobacter alkaliphilus AHT 1 TaxID=555088 RepID=C0GD69_DETAL|nr:hypothetical protein [Dethiobacter alkaliphilus]EEG78590.1 conserved hypothetical protein [Dethiobacter alkaliphilus AHT 1]MCW3491637.1 hypothetical protein [Dethiobacter alkaliphilus]
MTFIRKVANSNILAGIFKLPKELVDKQVEIIILPHEENISVGKCKPERPKKAKGILQNYKNEDLIDKEIKAWPEVVAEKDEYS